MVDEIFNLYEQYGERDYIGEDISQCEHMSQAAMLAEQQEEPIEIILACFFHDIGHLIQYDTEKMSHLGVKHHENVGANFLRTHGVPEPIPTLVENHVKTKKYKIFKSKDYYDTLSSSSRKTLEYQGKKMSEQEAETFESEPLFKWSCKVREYDDKAKTVGIDIKPYQYYKNLYIRYIFKKYFRCHL
tara:strand:- start:413 stop:973 length:561 start_codon:yes stop_codon:yes gene_type:complete